jgi:putative flippase GtrA
LSKSFWFTASYPIMTQFSDVLRTVWYSKYINPLSVEWVFLWYKDWTFRPTRNISRLEFIKVALKASWINSQNVLNTAFWDVNPNEWYAKYIMRAYSLWIVNGYLDWNFHPNQAITRWEVADILANILELQFNY